MIRWQDLDPARVERGLKALIRKLHPDAQGIDGSGGDDGQDTRWQGPDGLTIFEIKSFASRLTNSQKRQIKKSLTNAKSHNPAAWILIIPLDPSPAELTWFKTLEADFDGITLEWRGRDWLDGQFATHDDLRRYVEGTDYALLERAAEMGQEQAVLAGGAPDLLGRLDRLHRRAQEMSIAWAIDFSTDGSQKTVRFGPRSTELGTAPPVALSPSFAFPISDPAAVKTADELQRTLDYGGDVVIEEKYVKNIGVNMPEDLAALLGAAAAPPKGTVRLTSSPIPIEPPLPATLRAQTTEGQVLASLIISFTSRIAGRLGITVSGVDASGTFRIAMVIDYPTESGQQRGGRFNLQFEDMAGRFPFAMRPVADLIYALTEGSVLVLALGHTDVATSTLDAERVAAMRPQAELIIALDELQRDFAMNFQVPEGLTHEDLMVLKATRDLIRDGEADWPYRDITVTLTAEGIEQFLYGEELKDDRCAVFIRQEDGQVTCGPHAFALGPYELHAPSMALVNRVDLEAAMADGRECTVRMTCPPGARVTARRAVEPQP